MFFFHVSVSALFWLLSCLGTPGQPCWRSCEHPPLLTYFTHRHSHSIHSLCGVVWLGFASLTYLLMFSRAIKSSFYPPPPPHSARALSSKLQHHGLHEDRERRPDRVIRVPHGLCARSCAVSRKCPAQVCLVDALCHLKMDPPPPCCKYDNRCGAYISAPTSLSPSVFFSPVASHLPLFRISST